MHNTNDVNTLDEPIGKSDIIQDNSKPKQNDVKPNTTENIVTFLNVLKICLADKTGNIINDVINKAPITFMPITTAIDVNIETITFIKVVLVPVDFEKVSSNVTEKILL